MSAFQVFCCVQERVVVLWATDGVYHRAAIHAGKGLISFAALFQVKMPSKIDIMSSKNIFKVIFHNQGKLYEIYAREIYQGDLYGFVEIEALIFGENSAVVVDPSEERLKTEFAGVKRSFIPMHSIVRIDEVEKEGAVKVSELTGGGGNVTPFPGAIFTPGGEK